MAAEVSMTASVWPGQCHSGRARLNPLHLSSFETLADSAGRKLASTSRESAHHITAAPRSSAARAPQVRGTLFWHERVIILFAPFSPAIVALQSQLAGVFIANGVHVVSEECSGDIGSIGPMHPSA